VEASRGLRVLLATPERADDNALSPAGCAGGRSPLAYSIAAYAVVIGALTAYGVWVQRQRRQLMREAEQAEREERAG